MEKAQEQVLTVAQARAEKLNNLTITLLRKTVSEDRLFGSVGVNDIATAVTEAGLEVTRHEVRLPDGPFRTLGEYEVELHLYADINARITLIVAAEQSTAEN